jgi:hypothetical protein
MSELVELLQLQTPDALLIPQVRAAGIDFIPGQGDVDDLVKAGASSSLLGVIREATARRPSAITPASLDIENREERCQSSSAPLKAQGNVVSCVISIRKGPEDAMIGRLDNGDYFKATVQGWGRLDPGELLNLTDEMRNDLNRKVNHPLIWFVNTQRFEDPDYNKHYQALLDNTRMALSGHIRGVFIITLSDSRVPDSEVRRDGKFFPSKLASCNLAKDHCVAPSMIQGPGAP